MLYASLVPLWEGFDEPFHYGIVRDYGRLNGFPVTGKALVKRLAHAHPETLAVEERRGDAASVAKSTAGGSVDLF